MKPETNIPIFGILVSGETAVPSFKLDSYTARFSLHQVHGSQCTKEYYTKYS